MVAIFTTQQHSFYNSLQVKQDKLKDMAKVRRYFLPFWLRTQKKVKGKFLGMIISSSKQDKLLLFIW